MQVLTQSRQLCLHIVVALPVQFAQLVKVCFKTADTDRFFGSDDKYAAFLFLAVQFVEHGIVAFRAGQKILQKFRIIPVKPLVNFRVLPWSISEFTVARTNHDYFFISVFFCPAERNTVRDAAVQIRGIADDNRSGNIGNGCGGTRIKCYIVCIVTCFVLRFSGQTVGDNGIKMTAGIAQPFRIQRIIPGHLIKKERKAGDALILIIGRTPT